MHPQIIGKKRNRFLLGNCKKICVKTGTSFLKSNFFGRFNDVFFRYKGKTGFYFTADLFRSMLICESG